MRCIKFCSWIASLSASVALFCALIAAAHAATAVPEQFLIQVKAAVPSQEILSGRLLVFLKRGSGDTQVDINPFRPSDTWVSAKEIANLAGGGTVWIDANEIAYPQKFSTLPAGKYEMQAVLDVDHNYNYLQRTERDWQSAVLTFNWKPGGKVPMLTISEHYAGDPKQVAAMQALRAKIKPDQIREEHFSSALLTRFWGRDQQINAWVVLPPNYDAGNSKTYPTVYWTHGFSGNMERILGSSVRIRERMEKGEIPPMIWVMLDESIPQGTHEFADSVNNGPWGAALTTEFIPYLEAHYHMDGKANGRFLNGHSSGGWATLQLQVNYPKIFGGTWSTSPDPSDFHDFTGADLYAAKPNMYHHADGSLIPLIRAEGKMLATVQQFARLEDVLGPYGGQFASFDWVFSPKSDHGGPMKMFDRQTGAIDPAVVAYWHDHYDLANIVKTNWATRGADLRGRIHLIVGDADTFYLDGSAHKFQAVLDDLHADAHFSYLPGRTHFDLYMVGDDRMGLLDQIAKEMYAVARP